MKLKLILIAAFIITTIVALITTKNVKEKHHLISQQNHSVSQKLSSNGATTREENNGDERFEQIEEKKAHKTTTILNEEVKSQDSFATTKTQYKNNYTSQELTERFEMELDNGNWRYSSEEKINLKLYESNILDLSITNEVRCKSSICRIKTTSASRENAIYFAKRFNDLSKKNNWSSKIAQLGGENNDIIIFIPDLE